jgi:hypothetical protein
LKRFALVEKTIKDLDFSISYYKEGNIRITEIYPDKPIVISIDTLSNNIPYGVTFKCQFQKENKFILKTENDEWNNLISNEPYHLNQPIDIAGFLFMVDWNKLYSNDNIGDEILFKINDIEWLTDQYINKIKISPLKREASILQVSLEGTHPRKEVDFLNTLSENYISNGLDEKNANATRSINFIDQQLIEIRDSLSFIENRLQNFKSKNTSVNLSTEGTLLYNNVQELEREKAGLLVKVKYIDYLKDYVKNEITLKM